MTHNHEHEHEIMDEATKQQVREMLKNMKDEVVLDFFYSKNCQFCHPIEHIVDLLSELSDGKIIVNKIDFDNEKAKADEQGIDKAPAIVINRKDENFGIIYYGIPSGYEFSSLLEDILDVSHNDTALAPQLKDKVKQIDKPVHIMVFVTPTCPYCPRAVRAAHKFALLNKNIKAEMVEAMEFPELSNKYSVMAVPKIVINDKVEFEGAYPEAAFLQKIEEALKD